LFRNVWESRFFNAEGRETRSRRRAVRLFDLRIISGNAEGRDLKLGFASLQFVRIL
jgi:hypothetical protein